MSTESTREPVESEDSPRVPVEVLEAIEGLSEGHTASKDDIESVLKF